jgi:hypothetical protein
MLYASTMFSFSAGSRAAQVFPPHVFQVSHGGDPANPSDPTNPTNPINPINPIKLTSPFKPSDHSNPTNFPNPSAVSQPTEH